MRKKSDSKKVNRAIVIDPMDNVATAIMNLDSGEVIDLRSLADVKVNLKQSIPFGHKFALKRIEKGENVIKYGEVIGRTTRTIEKGEHVHIHNVESVRGRGDIE